MNAKELADYLDNNVEAMLYSEQKYIDLASGLLRTQQDKINALNRLVEQLKEELKFSYDGQ